MLSIEIGNTTIHLWPIILIFAITIVGVIIRSLWLNKQNRQLVKDCQTAQYDKTISTATKMLKYYQRAYKLFKSKKIEQTMETLNLYLAISYYGLSNNTLFIQHISLVNDSNNEKHFWLALYYLLENNNDEAQHHYEFLATNQNLQNYISYLNGIRLYKQGNYAKSKNTLEKVYPKLNFALLKDLIQKIII